MKKNIFSIFKKFFLLFNIFSNSMKFKVILFGFIFSTNKTNCPLLDPISNTLSKSNSLIKLSNSMFAAMLLKIPLREVLLFKSLRNFLILFIKIIYYNTYRSILSNFTHGSLIVHNYKKIKIFNITFYDAKYKKLKNLLDKKGGLLVLPSDWHSEL